MLKSSVCRWALLGVSFAVWGLLTGCAPSVPSAGQQSYTLSAQLPPLFQQTRIVAANIDVNGDSCSVRIVTLDSTRPWAPVCLVRQDQPTFKSFSIGGKQVDLGAVGDTYRVLQSALTTLPTPADTVTTAAKPAVGGTVDTTVAAAAQGPLTLPQSWKLVPYAGQHTLRGQNTGFMVTKAILTINGSVGTLAVNYKNTYAPLHLECTVTANSKGDYTLLFNPIQLAKITGAGGYTIQLIAEGQALSGNIWDSRGFDSWQPNLPPQWVLASSP
ncbi:MAG: hypothetical protein KGL98_03175 [Gammaproteobacteria bacterium]|nr:hypothetical protein [Gammaproteobacteria bacterium]